MQGGAENVVMEQQPTHQVTDHRTRPGQQPAGFAVCSVKGTDGQVRVDEHGVTLTAGRLTFAKRSGSPRTLPWDGVVAAEITEPRGLHSGVLHLVPTRVGPQLKPSQDPWAVTFEKDRLQDMRAVAASISQRATGVPQPLPTPTAAPVSSQLGVTAAPSTAVTSRRVDWLYRLTMWSLTVQLIALLLPVLIVLGLGAAIVGYLLLG